MLTKPHFIFLTQMTLAAALSLGACATLFEPAATPTPAPPTFTPVPPTPTPPPSVARVNDEYILLSDFEAEMARYAAGQDSQANVEEANRAVLEEMIAEVLFAQAAREAGFTLSESDLQARMDALANQLGGAEALSAWQAAHGYDAATFRAALKRSIEAAWMRDNIIANVPNSIEQIHLRQILTYNEADARSAYEQLQNGADFDELAALYDPLTLGELGWMPPGYLLDAKADAAVFALPVGAYSEVIATDAGFHIFKALERGEHALSPDALLTVQEQALQTWLDARRAASAITLAP
ncbi:MAG: hypothetical protein Fur002_18260 [Anaerolineales bacterium]